MVLVGCHITVQTNLSGTYVGLESSGQTGIYAHILNMLVYFTHTGKHTFVCTYIRT